MDFNRIFQSKAFKTALWIIAGLIVFLLVFKAGMVVGLKKAQFSYKWGENYHRNFGGPRGGFLGDSYEGDFIDAYGTFGQIIKIDGSTIAVKGRDDVEKLVVVKDDTTVKRLRDTVKLSDLKVNDYIVVIGNPNDAGRIEAKLIRLLPPASSFMPPPPSFFSKRGR